MKGKKLLAVDDHPVVLEGMRAVFEGEGYEVLKAGTVVEAEAIAEANDDIALFVVDLTLETDADGLELARRLRCKRPGVPTVIYTMHEEMWNIAALVSADVEGIVLKGEDVRELTEGVRLVSKGAIYRSPEFSDRYDSVKKARGILSQTDIEVLRLISDGLSSSEVSKKVNLSEKSVEYHRSNIIKKLGSKNMTEAIRNAVKLGIISCASLFAQFPSHAVDNVPVPVDLGLSVQWGDRNLGAEVPLEAGGYYAFGETETKELYDWSTYVNCEDGDMFSQFYLGDCCISGSQYDAATQLLGEGWRMPDDEEIEELIENCTWEFVDAEPWGYFRFTATNGESIEFPLVGYMSLGRVVFENSEGHVWSGSFYLEEGEEDGFVYRVNGPDIFALARRIEPCIMDISSHLGMQIRPVYVGSTGVSGVGVTESTGKSIYTIDGRRLTKATAPGLYIIDGNKTFIH